MIKNTKNGMMKNDNYQMNVERIIEFVQKSIDEEYTINARWNIIEIISTDNNTINIVFDKEYLTIKHYPSGYIRFEINEEDFLKLQLLLNQVKRFEETKMLNILSNFFLKKEENKVKDINDLDDEEK